MTRKTHALDRYAEAFSDMLVSVLHGTDLRTAVEECNQNLSGSNSLGGMLFRYWMKASATSKPQLVILL